LMGHPVSYTDAQGSTTTTTYDNLGRMSSRTSPLGTEAFDYDSYGRATNQRLDGTIIATSSYDSYSRLSSVTYPTAGAQSVTLSRDTLGRATGLDYILGNGTTHLTDTVTRSQSGQIVSGTELGASKSYAYDKAGRLTTATIGANSWSYGFGAPTVCTGTYNANSGKNSNRTSTTFNAATTTYCYDNADRLIASSDATVNAAQYDAHGNTTQLGTTPVTTFGYDSSDRNSAVTEGSKTATYTRDAQGRVIARVYNDGTTTTTNKYGFTGAGDTPDILQDASGNVIEKYVPLPGGVLLTKRSSSSVYSLVNVHGDVFATTDASGVQTGTYSYDPFGQALGSAANNTAVGSSYGWVGQHQKLGETGFTLRLQLMGARVYLASTGRFLQVDPIDGGTPNSYVYPPDPINDYDLTGESALSWWGNTLTEFAKGVYNQPIFGLKTLVVDPVKQMTAKNANGKDRAMGAAMLVVNLTPAGRGAKSIKVAEQVGKYTRITWTVNATNLGAPARAVFTKYKNEAGRTVRVIKDTYDRNNKLLHRKYKLWWRK
jgi:RHS repeat-associated protein